MSAAEIARSALLASEPEPLPPTVVPWSTVVKQATEPGTVAGRYGFAYECRAGSVYGQTAAHLVVACWSCGSESVVQR